MTTMSEDDMQPNEIIRFLVGKWKTKDVVITADKEIQSRDYIEIMEAKNSTTVTVTALGYDKGKDLKRDMTIELNDVVALRQGDFSASGSKHGNSISLSGSQDDRTYQFRMYLLDDKFIFQRDVIEQGNVVEAQMSYLMRISDL